ACTRTAGRGSCRSPVARRRTASRPTADTPAPAAARQLTGAAAMSNAHRRAAAFLGAAALLLPCSCSDSDDDAPSGGGGGGPPPTRQASRPFRAVAGISMGAFGALHLATARDDLFGAVAALGGPVDLERMLHHLVHDNLEVKEMPLGP